MYINILQYLEESSEKYYDKVAFDDNKTKVSFGELKEKAKSIGSYLIKYDCIRKPVVIYLPKGCNSIISFMGVAYAGGMYCPLDEKMPLERIEKILLTVQPRIIITDVEHKEKLKEINYQGDVLIYDSICRTKIYEEKLLLVREEMVDIDPLYVLFTSGSTGEPKGVVVTHRGVIDFIEWFTDRFAIVNNDIFGNQGDFNFDLSILELYSGLKMGATVCIIPRKKFLFPVDLLKFLNEKKISIINWVPSILCNIANLRALDVVRPKYLKKVFFCGEVMPTKHINVWRKKYKEALYVNFYGPTEIVYACTYYVLNEEIEDSKPLPIGEACSNTKILVFNDNDKLVEQGEIGELCVSGSCVSLGYYNNIERTKEVFVQNPINTSFNEIIYRTGDLVRYDTDGNLIYIARKDFQIKHLGHRIELGEIENAILALDEIENCVCLYDNKNMRICACYTGKNIEKMKIIEMLKKKIPHYMIPEVYCYYETLPYNCNGKIDRKKLKEELSK